MRLGIVSDVHGNLPALEAVVEDLRRHAPDCVVNLGDCATGSLWPRETVELLESLGWATVRGNHDRWLVEAPPDAASHSVVFTRDALSAAQRNALASLPAVLRPVAGALAVHGTPQSDTDYLLEDSVDGRLRLVASDELGRRLGRTDAELVLCGHSHNAHVAVATGGALVVNPGAVGGPRYADNGDPHSNEAGSPHARYAIATRTPHGWGVQLIAVTYPWSVVAERARANLREDFARGFLKGLSSDVRNSSPGPGEREGNGR